MSGIQQGLSKIAHISSLKTKVPPVQCLPSEPNELPESHWSIRMVTPQYLPICSLLIDLPLKFPYGAGPVVRLDQWMQHSWISFTANGQGIITGHPKLGSSWNPAQDDLGVVILDIISEFQKNPPRRVRPDSHDMLPKQNPEKSYETPSCPEEFTALNNMKRSELEFLEANQAALDKLIWDEPGMNQFLQTLETLLAENETIAKQNMADESKLAASTDDLQHLLHCFTLSKQQVDEALKTRSSLLERFSADKLIQDLDIEAAAINRKCTLISERLRNNNSDWSELARSYVVTRKEYHTLMAKQQKLRLSHL